MSPQDQGIIAGAYVIWVGAVCIFAGTSDRGRGMFGVFTKSLLRIVIALALLVTISAIFLFYLDELALVVMCGVLFAALFGVFYWFATRRGEPGRFLSWHNGLTVAALLMFFLLPAALTVWQRDEMNDSVKIIVGVGVALFWLFALLAAWFKTGFLAEVAPFGKLVTLLMFATMSMWMMLFAGDSWALPAFLVMGFLMFIILSAFRNDPLLAVSLRSHTQHPALSAFIIATVLYGAVGSMVVSLTTDQQDRSDDVFTITTLISVLCMLWFVCIIAVEAARSAHTMHQDDLLRDKTKPSGPVPVPPEQLAQLDVFACAGRKRKGRKVAVTEKSPSNPKDLTDAQRILNR